MKPLNQLLDLSGQAAIVTGGAQGIGLGIAYRFAEAGAKVLLADIDERTNRKAADELKSKGWVAEAFTVDVSIEEQVKRMVAQCRESFGSVDILVNNAG